MKPVFKILFVLALFSLTVNLQAQIKVDFKKKLENQVNKRLNQKTDQAIDKVLDTAEDSIAAGLKKDDSAEQAGSAQNGEAARAQGNRLLSRAIRNMTSFLERK
jgi:hypothetical protein